MIAAGVPGSYPAIFDQDQCAAPLRSPLSRHHLTTGSMTMTSHLTQFPVLLFALMMVSFALTLGPIAAADIIRSRKA